MSAITRRRFTGSGAGLASSLLLPREATAISPRNVLLPDGTAVTALGQGSARVGQGKRSAAEEEEALKLGLSLGLSLIDTAEIYGGGRAEELIGRAITGRRDTVFLVSKVLPSHATPAGIRDACTKSLTRLGTDYLDMYLLHWRGEVKDLASVVEAFEWLRADGLIRRWGVSNFAVADMDELFGVPQGLNCAVNQVPYSLTNRAVERGLLPWCAQHGVPIMAYSPLGGDNTAVLKNPVLSRIASAHGQRAAAVALAWAMRAGNTIAIPESSSLTHVRENAVARQLQLTEDEARALDAAFPI